VTTPNLIRIQPNELYGRIMATERFVLRVAKAHWLPEYGNFKIQYGDMVAYHSGLSGSVRIGIVLKNNDDTLVSLTVIPQRGFLDVAGCARVCIHPADILCRFIPYTNDKIWRLWMEYPGCYGGVRYATIKMDTDKKLLKGMRKDLRSKCAPEDKFKYYITDTGIIDV
jgi:hypothetical protein